MVILRDTEGDCSATHHLHFAKRVHVGLVFGLTLNKGPQEVKPKYPVYFFKQH